MKRVLPLLLVAACQCDEAPPAASASRALSQPPVAADLDPASNVVRAELIAEALPANDGPFRYAYSGSNPGPTIVAKVGDELVVTLENRLPFATTIHWHGVHVPWAMDGVTWMQDPIDAGASFTYRFTLAQAGTFWYHPHFDTGAQVDAGLYGMLVVEDPAEPVADQSLVLVFDNSDEDHQPSRSHGHGRLARRWLVNGEVEPRHEVPGASVVRTRLLNASNAGYLAISWPDMRHIGSDQGLLPGLEHPARLVLAPGDRADVELLVGGDDIVFTASPYSLNGGDTLGEPSELLTIAPAQPAAQPAPLTWPFPGGLSTPDPGYADIVYTFAGSDRTGRWLINGEAFPNVTVESVALGSAPIIEVRNLSPSEHPFHLHGVHFEVLSVNGSPPGRVTIEDTINLEIRDRVRLRVEADNPGDWMAHCHILPHADDGMMTVLRIQ